MVESKVVSRDRVELTVGGVECIELMKIVAVAIGTAKNRRDEQNARCLLIQLERAAESGKAGLDFDSDDYETAWNNCTTPVTA